MSDDLSRRIESAIKVIISLNPDDLECGRYDVNENFFYLVQEYTTRDPSEGRYEAHKQYVDIQYMAKGTECIMVTASAFMETDESYNSQTDVVFLKEPRKAKSIVLPPGKYEIFYPKDAHKPGLTVGQPQMVKKILGKVRI